jgi:pimeloyl-ACP methyl ester carboxylesterase
MCQKRLEAAFRTKIEAIRSRRCDGFFGGEAWMTIVLVHGNPETDAIWDDLVPHLRNGDVVRLSPPGFGSAIPSSFDWNFTTNWLRPSLTCGLT